MGSDSEISRKFDELVAFSGDDRAQRWILLCEIMAMFSNTYIITGVLNNGDSSIYRSDFKQILRAILVVLEVEFPNQTISPGSNILNEHGQCIANIRTALERVDEVDDVLRDAELNRVFLDITLYMNRMNYIISQMTV
tara:strand:+ start:1695 stop:2108 length:414 start_codon:yes stop_codon:yes gene_type:complete